MATEILLSLVNSPLFHVRDRKSSGVNGGTFTSGAFRTRDLNDTPTNEISGASLASNQVTLPPGTYFAMAKASCQFVGGHRLKLYDTTGAADLTKWQNGRTNSATDVDFGETRGKFTLLVTSVIELQHYGATTANNTGFGFALSLGDEYYSDVMIWKIG